jgi:hypothetical protein
VSEFLLSLLMFLTTERDGTQHDPGGGNEREAKSGGGEMAIDKIAKREPLLG